MQQSQRFASGWIGVWVSVCWFGCGAPAAPIPPPGTAPNQSQPAPNPSAPPRAGREHDDMIRVETPAADALVQSPLLVTGEARGPWFFEATFPVQLRDAGGRLLAESYAQAKGEWMTEAFVPFFVELRFEPPPEGAGVLVLEKANPSDLPEHAGELRIPLRFGSPPAAQ